MVLEAEQRFEQARLTFGHGTDNARDEAVFLVFHALSLPFDASDAELDAPLSADRIAQVERIVGQRIETRRPAAYLTGRTWFAGHEFAVDERVLVPRSPLGELVERRFRPWIEPKKIRRVLDIGTGSGCIAIAVGLRFPQAVIDATEISADALHVARRNIEAHALDERVLLIKADLYPGTPESYDLIISNPPYVPRAIVDVLPPEYRYEPSIALNGGDDGLDIVRRILSGAAQRLNEGGLLVLDVGEMGPLLEGVFPKVPFTWLDLEHGGEGVCVVVREQLASY